MNLHGYSSESVRCQRNRVQVHCLLKIIRKIYQKNVYLVREFIINLVKFHKKKLMMGLKMKKNFILNLSLKILKHKISGQVEIIAETRHLV